MPQDKEKNDAIMHLRRLLLPSGDQHSDVLDVADDTHGQRETGITKAVEVTAPSADHMPNKFEPSDEAMAARRGESLPSHDAKTGLTGMTQDELRERRDRKAMLQKMSQE